MTKRKTPEQLAIGRESSRRNSSVNGTKLYKDGKGIFARTQEQVIEDASKGGTIVGRKNVESGHWAKVSQMADRVEAAKKAGKIAVETGQIFEIWSLEASQRGGKTQGNNAVESGQWDNVRPFGLHVRWHVKNLRTTDSKFCHFCDTVTGRKEAEILLAGGDPWSQSASL
jgi:hypothetical protein